ncbi:MAG TPA: oxidoreductase [Actinopolymorphaceae bacterium]
MAAARWTAEDIPDLSERTAVVTGANSGIGLACAVELARHGATTVLACKDLRRGEAAMVRIKEQAPDATVELRQLDLADLTAVRAFASEIRVAHPTVDILLNNAHLMATPRLLTADGFELQLGINHLGHFALTGLLLPCLLAARSARVVTVTSMLHTAGHIDFDDLMGERTYGPWRAYAQSKLANLLFAFELARRAAHDGDARYRLVSVAAHPGFTATNLPAIGPQIRGRAWLKRVSTRVAAVAGQSAEQGALPALYAATAADVRPGDFIGPGGYGGIRGGPARVRPHAKACAEDVARALWDRSEELTGVRYDELR